MDSILGTLDARLLPGLMVAAYCRSRPPRPPPDRPLLLQIFRFSMARRRTPRSYSLGKITLFLAPYLADGRGRQTLSPDAHACIIWAASLEKSNETSAVASCFMCNWHLTCVCASSTGLWLCSYAMFFTLPHGLRRERGVSTAPVSVPHCHFLPGRAFVIGFRLPLLLRQRIPPFAIEANALTPTS